MIIWNIDITFYLIRVALLKDPPGVIDNTFDILKKRQNQLMDTDSEVYDISNNASVSASSDDIYSDFNTPTPLNFSSKDIPRVNKKEVIAENKKWLNELGAKLNKELDLDKEIVSLADTKAWKKLQDYINTNFGDFIINGSLAIEFHMRYFLCCYIFIFVPGEFAFFYPAAWARMVPDEILKIDIIKDVLSGIRMFQDFVKEKGETTFLVPLVIGRENTISEDLEFLVKIPILIFTEPEIILREFLKFAIKSEGYAEFKERNKAKVYW